MLSPTTGKPYTRSYILGKVWSRSGVLGFIDTTYEHQCFYGSRDYTLHVTNLGVTDAQMCNSVGYYLNGDIPVHQTNTGRMMYGYGCDCDASYSGGFPSEGIPGDPEWDAYKKRCGSLTMTAYLGEEKEDYVLEDLDDEEIKSIMRLVERRIVCQHFDGVYNAQRNQMYEIYRG